MAVWTREMRSGLTYPVLLMTRETVATDTPALLATSFMVAIRVLP